MTEQTTKKPEPDAALPKIALRAKEAARALGIGERKLWELTNRGLIPHVRLPDCKCILYPTDQLREWLADQSRPANGQHQREREKRNGSL